MIFKGYLFSILYVMLCLAISLVIYKLGVPKKITRKVVHILVGFEWVILYTFMGVGSLHFLAVCLLFLLLLFVEYKVKLLPMMSSDGDNAPGTVYYALAMSVVASVCIFVPNMIYPFGIAVFCTSFGDGLAGLVGQSVKKFNFKIWGSKSFVGGLVNLLVSFAVPFVFSRIFELYIPLWQCALIAFMAFELELFCGRGIDNLCITLGVAALSYLLMFVPGTLEYILPIMLTPLVIALVLRKKTLTPSGVLAALMLDLAVSIAFGNIGFAVRIIFFGGGVLTDKFKNRYKKTGQDATTEERTALQVFANGFIGMACALAYVATDRRVFLICFIAVFAEALADTAASGIGAASRSTYDIFRFRCCEKGESGGVSLIGTLAAVVASLIITAVPLAAGRIVLTEFALIVISAFIGVTVDSLLGSLLQAKYTCAVCGKMTEKSIHCDEKAERYRGLPFMTNSAVNFFSTVLTAVAAYLIFSI